MQRSVSPPMSDEEPNKTSTMAKDYKNHICGECRNYVPRHSAVIPELLIGQMNEGSCKPYKNGPAACMCQREMVACSNFRKRKKSPTGKRMCVCRECQYNNPTPDGHFCANTTLLPDVRVSGKRTTTTIRPYPSVSERNGMR